MRSVEPTGRAGSRSHRVEGDALHELHREVGDAAVVDRELVDGHDVRVLELPGDLRLGDEAVAVERLLRELLVEALQRDVAEQVAVRRRVDAPHAAARELLEDAQVRGRRDPLREDLLAGHLVVSADRDRFDDVDGRGIRIFGHGNAHDTGVSRRRVACLASGPSSRPKAARRPQRRSVWRVRAIRR